MVIQRTSVQEFEAFVALPENADKTFELINGEVVEKVPTNARASAVTAQVLFLIKLHLKQSGLKGHVTGADGGFQVGIDQYAPDVAYLSAEKQTRLDETGYNSVPPDIAVEIETHITAESERRLRTKIVNYLGVGTVVWVVYPESKEVEVYVPGQPVVKLGVGDTLTGGDALPGFRVSVDEIFDV